jgi:polysaccharide biosynthesis transport protein
VRVPWRESISTTHTYKDADPKPKGAIRDLRHDRDEPLRSPWCYWNLSRVFRGGAGPEARDRPRVDWEVWQMQEQIPALSLEQVLGVIRRRWWVILVCFVGLAGATYAFSKQRTKEYTATASLVLNENQINQEVAGLPATVAIDPTTQQNTVAQLLQLGGTASETAQLIGDKLTAKEITSSIAVNLDSQSNIIGVSSTWTSPKMAARIANTYVTQFVADQLTSDQQYFASALALVKKQLNALSPQQRVGPQGVALQDREQSLAILANLQSGNVQVAQLATVPTSPSSPKVVRNTVLGALLGLVLGICLVFLIERFDRRMREPRDFERLYGLPLLGVIPESTSLARHTDDPETAREPLPASEIEVFQMLRAHLRYFNVDRDVRSLMVVSAAPGDGKTTVARNLAEAGAAMGSRVLLIEADLRRPQLAKRLAIGSTFGLAEVLIGAASLSEAVSSVEIAPRSANGHAHLGYSLDVLPAGTVAPPNPAALIESAAMRDVLAQVRSDYELVIIDTPPLTAVSDAFPLLPQADGVIIVGRLGRNRRDVAHRLHEVLRGIDAPLLGVVANGFKQGALDSYGYGYGYGYGYTRQYVNGRESVAGVRANASAEAPAAKAE